VKLETEFGTYEGSDLKDIKKQMAKAERKHREKTKQRCLDGTQAELHARATGFTILDMMLDRESPPSGWRFYPAGHRYGPKVERHTDILHRPYHVMTYECEGGYATQDHYGYTVVGHVWNGAGHTIAVILKSNNTESSEPPQALAPGVYKDQIRFVNLPPQALKWLTNIETDVEEEAAAAAVA
jgi:hypothetical protein